MTERRADDATRDVVSWLKCEYLQDHVGEVFRGVISAVTGFGLFVEIDDLYVEGLIHVTALPKDYYQFEQAQQRLVGERSGMRFHLGDGVTVQVARVDLEERKVDFTFVELHPRPTYRNPKYRKPKTAKKGADVSAEVPATSIENETPRRAPKARKSSAAPGAEPTSVSGRAMEMAVEFQQERKRKGKSDFSSGSDKTSPWGAGLKKKTAAVADDAPRPARKRKVGSDEAEVIEPAPKKSVWKTSAEEQSAEKPSVWGTSSEAASAAAGGESAAEPPRKKRGPSKTPTRKGGKRPAVAARKAAHKAAKSAVAKKAAQKKSAKKKSGKKK
ncbi:S1 RNA-binding domain-containing protein [Microbulbifer sp. SH-1]|uniref:S1 RNA-binding domain-containing protein n=1 Tax=Microbulbifer sp. SH-1 TaxID=2681547 RepID=UPI00352FFF54